MSRAHPGDLGGACRRAVRPARHHGFSIVELMVAMVLSLILLAGVLSVVYSSKVTYYENERVAHLQESGRAAVAMIARDLRASGFRGCSRSANFKPDVLNDSGSLLWNFSQPLQGYEATDSDSWSPALDTAIVDPVGGNDIIAVRTVRADAPVYHTAIAMPGAASVVTIQEPSGEALPPVGRTLMISDCSAAAVFGVTAVVDLGTTDELEHADGEAVAGVGPGNATGSLGQPLQAGAEVVPVDTVVYYIRDSATERNGVHNPALWRIVGAAAPQELIEGVQALQIKYGVDNDGDGLVDTYVTADNVTSWSNVISVSIAMLIRSVEPNAPDEDKRTYKLLGTDFGPYDDHYQRVLYTTTVTLRNQAN